MMNPTLAEGARARCRDEFLFVSNGAVLSAIVLAPGEAPCVRIAVEHLRADLRALSALDVPSVNAPPDAAHTPCAAVVGTLGAPFIESLIAERGVDVSDVRGQREAFLVQRVPPSRDGQPHLLLMVGADAWGTRRAVCRVCERLGMDPMRPFTEYTPPYRPEVRFPHFRAGDDRILGRTPPVRWRGVFINDEERMKMWFTDDPLDVAPEAFERIFETIVRCDGNLLAPPMLYTDYMSPEVLRRCEDYGIVYTASHMEMLLFNPQCPARPGHWPDPKEVPFDYLKERDRMEAAWRESVRRHRGRLCVWPLGIRGAMDEAMANQDLPAAERARLTERIIQRQLEILAEELGHPPDPDGDPTSITLYKEVLDLYNTGDLHIPPQTIVIWPDDNYGRIRQLPTPDERTRNPRNGVYYHVGYCRSQWTPFLPTRMIASQLHHAIRAGCTELVLVNVSDAREFIAGWRAAMQVCTEPLEGPLDTDAAAQEMDRRFWATYCPDAADEAAALWRRLVELIYRRIPYWHMLHATQTLEAMRRHLSSGAATPFSPPAPIARDAETGPLFTDEEWDAYDAALAELGADIRRFEARVPERAQHVFHDQLVVYYVVADCVNRWVRGILHAARALAAEQPGEAAAALQGACGALDPVGVAYQRAAWGPFETWYRGDWVELHEKGFLPMDQPSWSLHPARSEAHLRAVLALFRPSR